MYQKRKNTVTVGAIVTILFILLFVTVNSLLIRDITGRFATEIESIPANGGYESARALRERFLRAERFIGLTVDHEDLTNIESSFADLIGALEAEDEASAMQAKSRLLDAIGHLKRLSTLNFDSIF